MSEKYYKKNYLADRKLMEKKKQKNCIKVLDWLWQGKTLTRTDGMVELNILNLPEVVRELRDEPYNIPIETKWNSHTNMAGETKRYGEYVIEGRNVRV